MRRGVHCGSAGICYVKSFVIALYTTIVMETSSVTREYRQKWVAPVTLLTRLTLLTRCFCWRIAVVT